MANNDIKVLFKKLNEEAIVPEYRMYGDAGCDLYSIEEVTLQVGETQIIKTGISIELPKENIEAQIRPRSGLAAKYGITVLNAPGTIDFGYKGEIMVILINLGKSSYTIKKGDRFAQMVFAHVYKGHFIEVNELSETDRGIGGMGHTGLN